MAQRMIIFRGFGARSGLQKIHLDVAGGAEKAHNGVRLLQFVRQLLNQRVQTPFDCYEHSTVYAPQVETFTAFLGFDDSLKQKLLFQHIQLLLKQVFAPSQIFLQFGFCYTPLLGGEVIEKHNASIIVKVPSDQSNEFLKHLGLVWHAFIIAIGIGSARLLRFIHPSDYESAPAAASFPARTSGAIAT